MDKNIKTEILANLIFKKNNIFFLFLILIIFILDRVSKIKILNEFSERTYFINDFLNIDLIWNIGIGFGFLSTVSPIYYNIVTAVIGFVIIAIIYIFIRSDNIDKFIYAIIIGGALGNFYDRVVYKAVPDFIDFHYNNFHWFTFNVADIFITIGILVFIKRGFFEKS